MVYLNPDYLVYSFSHSCHLSLCRQLVHDVAGFLQSHSKGVFVNCIFTFATREKKFTATPRAQRTTEKDIDLHNCYLNEAMATGCNSDTCTWSFSLQLLSVEQTSAFVFRKDKHEVIFHFIINTFWYNWLSCQLWPASNSAGVGLSRGEQHCNRRLLYALKAEPICCKPPSQISCWICSNINLQLNLHRFNVL